MIRSDLVSFEDRKPLYVSLFKYLGTGLSLDRIGGASSSARSRATNDRDGDADQFIICNSLELIVAQLEIEGVLRGIYELINGLSAHTFPGPQWDSLESIAQPPLAWTI